MRCVFHEDQGLHHSIAFDRKQIFDRSYPRDELATVLSHYNERIGVDSTTRDNINKLKQKESVCVVTGQQLGPFGGPAFTILKALTCLKVAEEEGAIPVFWLATEDHDISEVNHFHTLDPSGNIHKKALPLSRFGHPLEDLVMTEQLLKEVVDAANSLGLEGEWISHIEPGMRYAEAMITVLVKLFAGTGLVFLEPHILRPLAVEFFLTELTSWKGVNEAIDLSTRELEAIGEEGVFNIQPNSTNLFFKSDQGVRTKIHYQGEGIFSAGSHRYSEVELQYLIEHNPERFSPNVAARPIMQCALIPTLAYVAGPTEIAYHKQLKRSFEIHGIPAPTLIPRASALFVNAEIDQMLRVIDRSPHDDLPTEWDQIYPIETLPNNPSWSDLPEKKRRKKRFQSHLETLGLPYNGLHLIHNTLHPHGKPQERVFTWWEFAQEGLMKEIYNTLDWKRSGTYTIHL